LYIYIQVSERCTTVSTVPAIVSVWDPRMHYKFWYIGSVLRRAWWWLSRVETYCHKNNLCNKLLCLTKMYTLYELDKHIGMINVKLKKIFYSKLTSIITLSWVLYLVQYLCTMHYALSVPLYYFKFNEIKRKITLSLCLQLNIFFPATIMWDELHKKNNIIYTLSRYVKFSTTTTTALIVPYLLPVKGTTCETRIHIEMFFISIYSKLLDFVGISPD
jgi:hypothetical protein